VSNTFAIFNLPAGYDGYATVNITWVKVVSNGRFTAADFNANFHLGALINWYGVVFASSAQAAADFIAASQQSLPAPEPVIQLYGGGYPVMTGIYVDPTNFFSLFGSGEGLNDYDGSGVSWSLAQSGQQYPYLPSCA